MKSRPSRLLAKLRQGGIPTVTKINLSDPRVVEIAGLCGTDAVWLCNEHVPNDWIGLENQIRAARIHNVDSIVRVARGSYSDYVKPLEADATGIMVPHVASADEARQIVEWTRCHPLGKRALDGGNTDGLFCLLPMDDYIRQANTERIVILQIESPEALENVDAIAAVPGFDILLFGPGDFAHRIGKAGKLDDPAVVAARQRMGAAARKHGKYAMTAGLIAPFNDLVAEGYQIFNVGADVVGLGGYFKQRLDLLSNHINALPPASQFQPKSSPMPEHPNFSLAGKVIVQCGGSGLLGRALVSALCGSGATVIVASRTPKAIVTAPAPGEKTSGTVETEQVDIESEASLHQLRDRVLQKHGRVDGLVFNAVNRPMKGYGDNLAAWQASMATNATGFFATVRTFGDVMAQQGSGSIVNIASHMGMVGLHPALYDSPAAYPSPDYFFHKGGMINLTRYLASHYGSQAVRVNVVSPGGIFNSERPQPDAFLQKYNPMTMLGRMAKSSEIGGAVVFLLSDASTYITGANLPVDGGYSAK